MTAPYSISQLAKEFDITTRTIRFYEAEGLLAPERQGQNRIYQEADRVKLKLILRGKRLGLSLAESKEIIDLYDPDTGNQKQLHTLIHKIEQRQQALAQQLADIRILQDELDEAKKRCMEALHTHPELT